MDNTSTLQELYNFKQRCNNRQNEIHKEIACLRKEHDVLDQVISSLEDIIGTAESEIEESEVK
jgi:hypothetical protein